MHDTPTVVFDGGPRDKERDTLDREAPVIGRGEEGGVYQRTEEVREGLAVYRWQSLTDAEAAALIQGDLRSSQESDR